MRSRGTPITLVEATVIEALSSALNGIEANIAHLNRTADRIAHNGAEDGLAANLVDLKAAQRGVEANVVAARTADETVGTLLDVFA